MNDLRLIEEEKKEAQVDRRVPQGRLADDMDRYIMGYNNMGSVIESESERDSWPDKSVQASFDKQSDDTPKLMEDYLAMKREIAGQSIDSKSLHHQNANEDGANSMRNMAARKVGSTKAITGKAAQLQMVQNQMDSDRADRAQAQPY